MDARVGDEPRGHRLGDLRTRLRVRADVEAERAVDGRLAALRARRGRDEPCEVDGRAAGAAPATAERDAGERIELVLAELERLGCDRARDVDKPVAAVRAVVPARGGLGLGLGLTQQRVLRTHDRVEPRRCLDRRPPVVLEAARAHGSYSPL